MSTPVTTETLTLVTNQISKQLSEGFDGVHERITGLENRLEPQVVEHGKQIAVLEDRARKAEEEARLAAAHVRGAKRSTAQRASAWGTGAAAGAYMLIEFVKSMKHLLAGH